MPWTDESDHPAPSTTPEAGRSEDGAAPRPKATGRNAGRKPVGPWGAPPEKRLGRPGKSAPAPPPAAPSGLEALTRTLSARAVQLLHRPGGRGLRRGVAAGAIIGFLAGWALSGVYEVRPGERAVVTRLGVVTAVAGPGLHLHPPWPLAQVRTLPVARAETLTLGGMGDDGSQTLTPTADGQAADVSFAVQWRVADPVAYLDHLSDPQAALKLSAEAAIRQAVGGEPLVAAMGADRSALQRRVAAAIQQRLDRLGAGIAVTSVLIQAVGPPSEVQAAAGDIAAARQDADAAVADAGIYRARVLAEAKASAAKAIIEAQSYRDQTLREAEGAAKRFEELDAAYRRAPGVTKDRLYFETLQGVLSRAHTVILDPAKGATVALPPDLLRGAPPGAPATTQATSPKPAPSGGPASSPGASSPGVAP